MVVFASVSQNHCMEVEETKLVCLWLIKGNEVLGESDKLTVEHDCQEVGTVVLLQNILSELLAEGRSEVCFWKVGLSRVLLFIEQNVCIFVLFKLEIPFDGFILASKAVLLDPSEFDFLNELIIEAVPLLFLLD